MTDLSARIDYAWNTMTAAQGAWKADEETLTAIEEAIAGLDCGRQRVLLNGVAQDWVRKAILLYFRSRGATLADGGYDKIPLKTANWSESDFQAAGFRMVPGAIVRRGAFVSKDCVLMPCFVNIGAHIGEGTMIDTWASVGSCAQIGRHVHLSGGAGIGGVLEPLQARPVIIGDNAFIGARSEIVEGVEVGEGAVIAMGTFISGSTKIIDRATGVVTYGMVPPYAVVVPGSLPDAKGGPSLSCAVIVKTVDAKTLAKVGVNELLRAA